MSLIVEDGTGKADAESYCSVAAADTYWGKRGLAVSGTEGQKETFLRRATDYMTQNYSQRWKGYRIGSTQALDWPRNSVDRFGYILASTDLPPELAKACAELAYRASTGELLEPDVGPQVQQEVLGPLSTSYFEGGRQNTKFTSVDKLLSCLLDGSDTMVTLERA